MTPEGTLSWAAQTIASIISILGPELILLSCRLIVQIDGLIKELEKYVPGKYIPEIIQIDSVKDYMLLGLMILCTEAIEENQRVEGGPSPCSPCRGGAASAAIFLSAPCTIDQGSLFPLLAVPGRGRFSGHIPLRPVYIKNRRRMGGRCSENQISQKSLPPA